MKISRSTAMVIFAAITAFSTSLAAYVSGGTNFGFSGYPKPSCFKPFRPTDIGGELAMRIYITNMELYRQCVTDYIENANNDIKRIREAQDDLIEQVKRENY